MAKPLHDNQREQAVVSARGYASILTDRFLQRALTPECWFTSPYEVLDYRSSLVIHDSQGMRATVARRQRIRFLQDGVTAILDHAWGDGVLTSAYSNTAGELAGSINDYGRRHFVVGLKRRMRSGEVLDFEVRREVIAALTTDVGWLQTTIDHPVARVGVEVIFPKDRPCKRATLTARGTTVPLPIAETPTGLSRLHDLADRPGRDVPHMLRWTW